MDKNNMKKGGWKALRTCLLTVTAVFFILSATFGMAWAYFTTYATAKGGITLRLGHEETITEYFQNWNKQVNITITKDSRPVLVRARGYCADYPLTYSDVLQNVNDTPVNNNWKSNGEWMYYMKVLSPVIGDGGRADATADPLFVRINNVPEEDIQGLDDKNPFNVIIVYETTEDFGKVEYDANGNPVNPWDADWDGGVE